MAKSLLSALAAMAFGMVASTAANAAVTFDFTAKYTTGPNAGQYKYLVNTDPAQNGYGNAMTFRSVENPLVKVKVTAWSIDRGNASSTSATMSTTDDIVTKAVLKLWDGGFGVQNMYETDNVPNHSIDNGRDAVKNVNGKLVPDTGNNPSKYKFMTDFLMLQFDYDTDLNSMSTGWVQTDSDASVRLGSGPTNNQNAWNSTPLLNGMKVYGSDPNKTELTDFVTMGTPKLPNAEANDKDLAGTSAESTRTIPGSEHGMTWLIGALYNVGENDDYFKLDALNATIFPTVPEPSTWMTMIFGFGFVGWGMRRRGTLANSKAKSLA